jgi:hypothetical protein
LFSSFSVDSHGRWQPEAHGRAAGEGGLGKGLAGGKALSEMHRTMLLLPPQILDQVATVASDGRIVAATCLGFGHMDANSHALFQAGALREFFF